MVAVTTVKLLRQNQHLSQRLNLRNVLLELKLVSYIGWADCAGLFMLCPDSSNHYICIIIVYSLMYKSVSKYIQSVQNSLYPYKSLLAHAYAYINLYYS